MKAILLHLLPGLFITSLYVILTPFFNAAGYPSQMALMVAFLLVILPFEWGYLLLQGKKNTGTYTLKSVLLAEPVRRKTFVLWLLGGIIIIVLIAGMMQVFDARIKEWFANWLPPWYFFDEEYKQHYSRDVIMLTAGMRIIVDGILIPVVEEQYFRGYLLPRMEGKGIWVPIIASLLFALYHFWQPWNYLTLALISAVLVFTAWRWKTYKISLYIHLTINLLGAIAFFLLVSRG